MGRDSLPPGFRFHPTDEELVKFYLKRKVLGKALKFEVISEIELYKFSPWDLPDKSCLKSRDLEWYFFCPRDRKYSNGSRANRVTEIGYWKTTGKDRAVCNMGIKRTLIFYLGKAPRGDRTNWVMHEYRLQDKELSDRGILQDAYVLCKIFEKSGRGPKNGEQHGAPFKEEEWNDVDNEDCPSLFTFINPVSPCGPADHQTSVVMENSTNIMDQFNLIWGSCADNEAVGSGENLICSPDAIDVDELLLELTDNGGDGLANSATSVQRQDIFIPQNNGADAFRPNGDDVYNRLGDREKCDIELDNYFRKILSDVDNGHIIKLDDLSPLEHGLNTEYGMPNNPYPQDQTLGISASEVIDEGCILDHPNALVHEADEMGNRYALQSFSQGKRQRVPSAPEYFTGGESYSKLHFLLDSIPYPPASAAEYSPPKGEENMTDITPCSSPIQSKAQVTMRCMNKGGHSSDSQRGAHRSIYCDDQPSKKPGRMLSSDRGGFMFVSLLGMASALVWVFVLAICAQFGRYVWKNFR